MYILDKNKDYYDYVSGLYGIDKSIVYDRRGSTIVSNSTLIMLGYHTEAWNRASDKANCVIIEIGYTQYLIQYYDLVFKKTPNYETVVVSFKSKLLETYKNNKHFYDKEVSIVPCRLPWRWRSERHLHHTKEDKEEQYRDYFELTKYEDFIISNPIVNATVIPSHIPAFDAWKEISTFISSKKNDRNVDIENSDVAKLENHGFDKKSSFRNPIKL